MRIPIPQKCPSCNYIAYGPGDTKARIKDHIYRHHELKSCKYCDFQTINNRLLLLHIKKEEKHLKTQEFMSSGQHKCNICDFEGKSEKEMESHSKAKHKIKCAKCEFVAARKETMKLHVKTAHIVFYLCEFCEYKTSSTRHVLQEHVRTQHEGYKYKCGKCDYETKSQSNLRIHIKAKHEGVEFSCSDCQFKTSYEKNLRQHREKLHQEKLTPDQIFISM